MTLSRVFVRVKVASEQRKLVGPRCPILRLVAGSGFININRLRLRAIVSTLFRIIV
jgi:hypothetical protein